MFPLRCLLSPCMQYIVSKKDLFLICVFPHLHIYCVVQVIFRLCSLQYFYNGISYSKCLLSYLNNSFILELCIPPWVVQEMGLHSQYSDSPAGWKVLVSNLSSGNRFISSKHADQLGTHLDSCSMGNGYSFCMGEEWLGCEADLCPPAPSFSAEVKNEGATCIPTCMSLWYVQGRLPPF